MLARDRLEIKTTSWMFPVRVLKETTRFLLTAGSKILLG